MPSVKKRTTAKKSPETTSTTPVNAVKNTTINSANPSHPVGCKCLSCNIKNGGFASFFTGKFFTPILVILLIIAVFFIGILVEKVSTLQSQNGNYAAGGTTGTTAPTGGMQPGQKVNVSVGHLPALGNKNAPVTIIEFADLRCPFCKQFFTTSESQLINDYVKTGKASFYFRHYAFLGPSSIVAANAAECANEQGKFWQFHDYMYQNQPDESDTSMYNTDSLTTVAGQLGMNTDQFRSCLSANKYQKNVDGDLADGQKAGVNGTPSFFINGYILVGALPYDSFKTAVDCALKNGKISTNPSNGTVSCN